MAKNRTLRQAHCRRIYYAKCRRIDYAKCRHFFKTKNHSEEWFNEN